MKYVDCRKCKFFKPVEELSEQELHDAWVWIAKNRPGEELLGYCTKFDRPVTYFTGKCYGFERKEVKVKKLDIFFKA